MLESHVFLQGPFKVDFKKGWPPAEERRAAGLAARTRVSRRELGGWEPADEVRDPVDVVTAVARPRQQRLIAAAHGAHGGLAVHVLSWSGAAHGR